MDFLNDWKCELNKHKDAIITTNSGSVKIRLSLNEDVSFMFYGQLVAKKFRFQHPTRVMFDYKIARNEFEMTCIETMEIGDRPTTFETVISPLRSKIKIPSEFHELWKRELNRLSYGRIVAEKLWAQVNFEMHGTEYFMHGNQITEVFGIEKPIRVLLDYKITNNDFHMTFVSYVEDVEHSNQTEVLANESDGNESDGATEVQNEMEEEQHEEDDAGEEENDLTVTWNTTVTKAISNLSKKQVLHFPNPISRGVLANTNQIQLIAEDSDFEIQCKVHTSNRSLKTGKFEKHIGRGWYEYVRLHRPRIGDNLVFVLYPEREELYVKLERFNMNRH
ncbi:uncharacterized protein LOC123910001 [Trifolium pratense]|uniref:uncharacterized protein LOC123910001 n=1 Tax=Trifolium pratense TaxID=57577 RepID=UPI001E69712C|nr:uncharacterized protein LOC123910001 [Trifolium pratense]